jgi:hypothetical protein
MENQDFRNYNVCAKVTANQKKLYTELATKAGLSLSEWLGSRIDMSIENEIMLKSKRIVSRRINRYNYKNNVEKNEMIYYDNGGNVNYSSEQQQIAPVTNNFTQQKTSQSEKDNSIQFMKEINSYNSTANRYNTIGVMAFLGALLLKQN